MKVFVTIAILASICACGTGEPASPSSGPPLDSPPIVFTEDDSPPVNLPLDEVKIGADAGSPGAADATPNPPPTDSGACGTTIGHCLTNMATKCYETSFDDTVACNASGQSSGWHLGFCEAGARSSGGCLVGCDVTYSYPLGGGDATPETRAVAKQLCESVSGTYIDTTLHESDSGTF